VLVNMHFVLTHQWEQAVQLTISETKNENLEDLYLVWS